MVAAAGGVVSDVDSLAGLGTSELLDAAEELDTQDLEDMGFVGTDSKQLMGLMDDLVEVRGREGEGVRDGGREAGREGVSLKGKSKREGEGGGRDGGLMKESKRRELGGLRLMERPAQGDERGNAKGAEMRGSKGAKERKSGNETGKAKLSSVEGPGGEGGRVGNGR